MELKRRHVILIAMFLVYLSLRLFFSLQTEYFNDDYSYFALRQIEHIKETGLPLTEDTLSYSGRTFVTMPFYFYLLAMLTLFLPQIAMIKIVNSLLASTIIIAAYLVASRILKNRRISLLCAAMAATLPIYIAETLNSISTLSIVVPGGLFLLYLFLDIEKKDSIRYLIPLTIFLVLITPSTAVLVFGIVIFLMFRYLDKQPFSAMQSEFASFMLLLSLWVNIIIFKHAFQEHSFSIVLRNLPARLLTSYFSGLTIFNIFANIGLFPMVFGIYAAYMHVFRKKNEGILLFISLLISIFSLLWLKLITIETGLTFFGVSLVVLSGQFLRTFLSGLKKTKVADKTDRIFIMAIVLIVLVHVVPGIFLIRSTSARSLDEGYVEGFEWLAENTPEDSVILGLPEEGHMITYFGRRENVMDTEFLLVDDVDTIFNDVLLFYDWRFKISAIRVLQKYGVDYIILSDKAAGRSIFSAIDNEPCFILEYADGMRIYRNRWDKDVCELR